MNSKGDFVEMAQKFPAESVWSYDKNKVIENLLNMFSDVLNDLLLFCDMLQIWNAFTSAGSIFKIV